MRQCPQCSRNSLGYNMKDQEQCIYKDCRWVNVDNVNVDKVKHVLKIKGLKPHRKKKI